MNCVGEIISSVSFDLFYVATRKVSMFYVCPIDIFIGPYCSRILFPVPMKSLSLGTVEKEETECLEPVRGKEITEQESLARNNASIRKLVARCAVDEVLPGRAEAGSSACVLKGEFQMFHRAVESCSNRTPQNTSRIEVTLEQ